MRKSLRSQIEYLKKIKPEIPSQNKGSSLLKEKYKPKFLEAIKPILEKMREDHKQELIEGLDLWFVDKEVDDKVRDIISLLICSFKEDTRGIYLGPDFYEAYKNGALHIHECEDCGCGIPLIPGYYEFINGQNQMIPSKVLTKTCPLCGGKTGYCAYYNKHGKILRGG